MTTEFETWHVVLIIVVVVCVILGNISLLKYANKFNTVKSKTNELMGAKSEEPEHVDANKKADD
ncbi:DUF2897 family protein [Pseudoalteromonas xiamenensis]|uniref:DUF2897 family protein n=1 Tax=Pseudoalteromonas xiamenensis TaxID=882626 RepID=UPI0027E4ABF3|nr:DUF2897 family protein [Pseudoalteromonas xiamenensis]WMN60423.1 DUF2897 family protein [Pseudoalteromonas xiamenensis]